MTDVPSKLQRPIWNLQMSFDLPVDVEDIPEFHASRLLLLMLICGTSKQHSIRGRTKLAKLDFFVRYPKFLEIGLQRLRREGRQVPDYAAGSEGVEASMVRYKFGPWDFRYYDLLGMLSGRGLIAISADAKVETYRLTGAGTRLAETFASDRAFAPVAERCRLVSLAFAEMKGTDLKRFVYDTFVREVANLPFRATIRQDPTGGT